MFRGRKGRSARQKANEYASQADFQKIFSEDMAGLHLLAYLLTASQEIAEKVFVAGLEDSINGNPVFRQWARSWSQRAIIKRAIKAVGPSPSGPHSEIPNIQPQTGNLELDELVQGVARLNTFERFVFVLSILEGYSINECATLLACPAPDIVEAKSEALQKLAAHSQAEPAIPKSPIASWKSIFTSAEAS
jgi:DNA-directed RNA polymerase specialized sigma24 family protein